MNQRYLESTTRTSPTFHFFCFKIEIDDKIKWLFASGYDWHHIGVKIYEKQQILWCPNC